MARNVRSVERCTRTLPDVGKERRRRPERDVASPVFTCIVFCTCVGNVIGDVSDGGRPGQGMSVEHHEEVSCTGRIALVCTRVLGPHNVLDTIGTFGCRTILIALGDVRTGEWTMVGPRNALLEGPDRDGCLELCTNANGLHEIAAWISAGK